MTSPKTAMVLAAGLGLRMRPLTDNQPKAMITVSGQPLIGHLLDRLDKVGVDKIVVNLHYKPAPLKDYLQDHRLAEKIVFSDERDKILETGGGVQAALGHLGAGPFYVVNCDAFFPDQTDNPFENLAKGWREGMGGLLLLKDTDAAIGYAGAGDFFLENDSHLRRRGDAAIAPFTFTGAQILNPALFDGGSEDVFSLNKIYDRALAENSLFGLSLRSPWLHMGTPEMVAKAKGIQGQ